MKKINGLGMVAAILGVVLALSGCFMGNEEQSLAPPLETTLERHREEGAEPEKERVDAPALNQGVDPEEKESNKRFPFDYQEGDMLGEFEVKELGEISQAQATTVLLSHGKSGANVLCVANDDEELGFSLVYRTPALENWEVNRILERVVPVSSAKYSSTDLFQDLEDCGYAEYLEKKTFSTGTRYSACCRDEEHLKATMDVFFSCIGSPEFLTKEYIFKKEGVRYSLSDWQAAIELKGNLFEEDLAELTNMEKHANTNGTRALYANMEAGEGSGCLYERYQDISYEKAKEAFQKMYRYDHCLIILYGNMDYPRITEFLDREYLSLSEDGKEGLPEYIREKVPGGYTERIIEVPAYEGNEEGAELYYAMDLSRCSLESIGKWEILTKIMEAEDSPLQRHGKENGIPVPIEVEMNRESPKPYLAFRLKNAKESWKQPLKTAVLGALGEIADRGIEEELFWFVVNEELEKTETVKKGTEGAGEIFEAIAFCWTRTDRVDWFEAKKAAVKSVAENDSQMYLKELAKQMQAPDRSALVVNVPVPGLAERKLEAIAEDLAQRKAGMKKSEINELIKDTGNFEEWNGQNVKNREFIIVFEE